jgi:ADP-ribosylglycohydrolase
MDLQSILNDTSLLKITDDTQMAMFGLEAIIRSLRKPSFKFAIEGELREAYIRWLHTQQGPYQYTTGLASMSDMQLVEAPGNTCILSLNYLQDTRKVLVNDRKGCGGVMRLLPFIGLFDLMPFKAVQSIARYSAALTHGHAEVAPAVDHYLEVAYRIHQQGLATVQEELRREYPRLNITDYGTGWTAKECIDMALWAVGHAGSFDEMLILSTCHKGDSDSVGAVAGSLWGLSGDQQVYHYTDRLLQASIIDDLVAEYEYLTQGDRHDQRTYA